jgi:hypothetical protein
LELVAGPFIGGGFCFRGKALDEKGLEICTKLRTLSPGKKVEFVLEDLEGRRASGIAKVEEVEIDHEPADERTLWKFSVECKQI